MLMLVFFWYYIGIKRIDSLDTIKGGIALSLRFIIGVDGGGTGTRARVCSPEGSVLGFGEAGPSGLSQGVEQAWRHVLQASRAALAAAGSPDASWSDCALGAGLAGEHVLALREAFIATQPQHAPGLQALALASDALAALLGAHGGQPGLVLVAGTGSVAEALWADGHHRTVGGWGFGVGDEGSGAWLGLQAVRHAHHVLDGQVAAGPLAKAILAATGADVPAMRAWCAQAGQRAYAALAPLVFEHEAADPMAAALLRDAATALSDMVRALDPAGQLPVVCSGSIAQRLLPYLPPMLRNRCRAAQGDAADGALHLVCRKLGLTQGAAA